MEKTSPTPKLMKLDGRTGEGGGQLVRVAVALSALTGTPIRIENVRGNRGGGKGRGGGLKAQHAACIACLAQATAAELKDCFVGSKTFSFTPKILPESTTNRTIKIAASSAASIQLVFQAILPFFIFAANAHGSPITITIQGGTNVSFSLSYEYLDQVLLPALERFGVFVERKLVYRGFSSGTRQIGEVKFGVKPVELGACLMAPDWPREKGSVTKIDVSLVVPRQMLEVLKMALLFELGLVFPDVEVNFKIVEDSKHDARIYTLLVAHTSTDLRFGRDWLYDRKTKNRSIDEIATEIAQKVVDELDAELRLGGVVDEYLQDQLVVFQALAEGRSNIPRMVGTLSSDGTREDRTDEPFGEGSLHTTTARWVASQLLSQTRWFDGGRVCGGAGWKTQTSETKVQDALGELAI